MEIIKTIKVAINTTNSVILKKMTESEFEEFIGVEIPSALFHVMPTDIDDEKGVRLDELILLRLLNEKPEALKYRSLSWFINTFIN